MGVQGDFSNRAQALGLDADKLKAAQDAGVGTPPSAATKTVAGVVKQSAHVANAAGANPTQAEYNALLAALVAAGIMAAS